MLVGSDTKTVVVNPCLCPSVELPKLGHKNYDVYKPLEQEFIIEHNNRGPKLAMNAIGFFGSHDELFSYKKLFGKIIGTEEGVHDFDSGHHISIEGWQELKSEIEKFIG